MKENASSHIANHKEPRQTFKPHMPIFCILALAVCVRVLAIQSNGLWLDEAYSVHLSKLGFLELVRKLSIESTPPFYYLCVKVWAGAFGFGELSLRMLSVMFSLAGLLTLYACLRRFSTRTAAIAAATVMAVCPISVYYAQEVRMYALLGWFAIILGYFFLVFFLDKITSALFGFLLCSLLMALTHNISLFLLLGFQVTFFAVARDQKQIKRWLAGHVLLVMCLAPWMMVILKQIGRQDTVLAWFVPFWERKFFALHLVDTFRSFSFGPYPPYLAMHRDVTWEVSFQLILLALFCFGIVRGGKTPYIRLMVLITAVSLTCLVVYSSFVQPVYIPARTDHFVLPFLVLILALGIDGLRSRNLKCMIVLGYCVFAVLVLIPYYQNTEKNDSRKYLHLVKERLQNGDIVISTGLTYAVAEYYLSRWNIPVTIESYPLSMKEHPGYINYREYEQKPSELANDARFLREYCAGVLKKENSVIILMVPHRINLLLINEFRNHFKLTEEVSLFRIPVQIFRWSLAS